MIKSNVLLAINRQIQHEQSNARAYEAVSLYFGHLNLHGLEAFMVAQVEDERMHAARLARHVTDRGSQVDLTTTPAPRMTFDSPLEAVNYVRDLERTTTEMIHRLFELARREADPALEVALHWFVSEQVEEEQWSGELATLMEQFHERPGQVFMLDHQWGKRVEEKHA
jgi:ferritin